jgi:hypothetical protein
MEINQKLKIPELSSYNDLFINYDGNELSILSSTLDLKEAEEEAVRKICMDHNVSFDGQHFFIRLQEKDFDFKKLNENIERIKSAVIEFVSKRERTEVFSVRLPLYLKSELVRLAESMKASYPELIEKMFYNYKFTHPSLFERKETIIEKEEFQSTFRRVENFKPVNKRLEEVAKIVKKNFKNCVLACSKFDTEKYYDLIAFFEKPRVNIYFNLKKRGSNICVTKRKKEGWDEVKEKAGKHGIKAWESLDIVSLYVPIKSNRDVVKGIRKIINFLEKEKLEWGWWY